jgi:hypothetical protein
VLWSASGKATVLQNTFGSRSGAIAINDAGQSVGQSLTLSRSNAVLWSPSGKATLLQDAGGQGESVVYAINDSGWSVGGSCTTSDCSGNEAVLWSPSGKATNLGAVLGSAWSDTVAVGLNDSDDIIGYGYYHGGTYGFLLTPGSTAVPEASTWAMLLVGCAGVGFAGYRRAKKGSRSARGPARQMRIGSRSLGGFPLDVVRVDCPRCDRRKDFSRPCGGRFTDLATSRP